MKRQHRRKGILKRAAGVFIVLLLLLAETAPLVFAESSEVGTPGNDSLRGVIYDFAIDGDENAEYTDPGGNDRLSNAVIKNSGYGSGRATFIKDSGSYTVNSTLTLSNVALLCSDMRLSARGTLSIEGLLAGSSVNLTAVGGRLPRVIATGATPAQLGYFNAPEGVSLHCIDGSIVASSSPLVFFDGNGATREPAPAYLAASRNGTTGRLPRQPQRTDYVFKGWNLTEDGSGDSFTGRTQVTGELTVYAKWELSNPPKTSADPAPAPIPEKRAPEEEPQAPSAGMSGSSAVSLAADEPDIRVTEDSNDEPPMTSPINFGTVLEGSDEKVVIKIRVFGENLSGSIDYAVTGAGYTVEIDSSIPWSNTGGRLILTFDSTGRLEYNYNGVLTLSSTVDDVSVSFDLRASVRRAFIETDPGILAFGDVTIGMTKTIQLEVKSVLSGVLVYELLGADNWRFVISEEPDWSNKTGGTLNITLNNPPSSPGPISGVSLRISSSTAETTAVLLQVTGQSVLRSFLTIADPVNLQLDFSATVGYSQSKTITILSGMLKEPITVNKISGEVNDYSIVTSALDPTDNPAPGGLIYVIFNPGAEGVRNCVLEIAAEDFRYEINLFGIGRSEQETPEIRVSIPSISFGMVYIGEMKPAVAVTVTGLYLTQDIQVQILDDLESNFSFREQTNNWYPRTGGVIEVFFNPKSIGAKSARLWFYTEDGEQATVILGGAGAVAISPVITSESHRPEVFAGEQASFTVVATGAPLPTYEWSQSANGVDWVTIAGANSYVYTIPAANATHNNMNYRCYVTNGFGSATSSTMRLTVLFPSLAVTNSDGIPVRRLDFGQVDPWEIGTSVLSVATINLMVGRDVTHTITGADASAFSCARRTTWTNSGGELTVEFKPTVAGKIYNAVLTISTQFAENVIIDLAGSSFPPPPPSFIKNPVSQLKVSGETAEFSVALASETARYTLIWQKKGARAGDDWMDIQGATGTLLRVPAIISESGAQYRCVAHYKEGVEDKSVVSSVASLTVASPVIRASVRSLGFGRVVSGERVSLTLTVSGDYLTRDIDVKLGGADASAFTVTKGTDWHAVRGGTLIVDFKPTAVGKSYAAAVTISSAGAENVVVDTFGIGSQLPPPSFLTDPDDVICDEGDDVTLSVTLKSDTLDYKLKWQKLLAGADEWTDISGSNRTTLTLRNVPKSDNGAQYRCIAEYTDDSSSSSQKSGTRNTSTSTGTVIESSAATLTVYLRAVENPGIIRGLGYSATFRFDGDLAKVRSVRFNGEYLGLDNSKVDIVGLRKDGVEIGQMSAGSVVITFYSEFVDTLADGRYPVLVTFEDESIHRGVLVVGRASGGGPYTGDDNNATLWYAMMAVSVSGMGITYVVNKEESKDKRKKKQPISR